MPFDLMYVFYGATFLAALLLIEGGYYLYVDSRAGRDTVNRRMRMLEAGASTREVFETLRRKQRDTAAGVGLIGDLVGSLDRLIQRAGLIISTSRVLVMMAALTVLVFLGILLLTQGAIVFMGLGGFAMATLASAFVGIVGPIVYLKILAAKRRNLFAEQLPDALDVMVRSLHAGHPVSAAMNLVTKELPDPIGSEFGVAVDEMTYGLDMREALSNLGDRVDLEDYQYVVVAINIQHDTGGNLAEVLHGLATVIRARFSMFKKIRALSAESRLSAKILAVLPFVFGAFTFSAKPQYYLEAAGDPLFVPFLGVALALEAFGIWIMYKLVNFRF